MTSWEIIHKASEFIAEEMGVMLKRSAMSPNITVDPKSPP